MEDATLDETTSTGIRPLPRRTLPPLQSGDKLENSNTGVSTDKSPSKQLVTPRKRRPKRQNVESTSQPAMESSSRSLPVPSSTSLEGGAEVSPNTSATSTTASGNARARRRQGNRKTRKTPSPDVISNGHALTVNEEDVVPVERLDEVLSMTTLPGVPGKGGANSQAQDRVYVQTNSGFKSHTDDWLVSRMNKANQRLETDDSTYISGSTEVALSFHRAFLFLTLLLSGLLAGLAVMQMAISFVLRGPSDLNFFEQYRVLAQPIQSTFYILIILCLVAAMDRLNLGKLGSSYFISLCKIDPGAWAVFVYIVALGMDVGISGFDFWLGRGTVSAIAINGGTNSTTLNYDQLNLNSASSLTTWSALNVLRAVLVVIGWILLALNPTTDATSSREFVCGIFTLFLFS